MLPGGVTENPLVKRFQLTLTSAQIKTLQSVGTVLLPAPGPNKVLAVLFIFAFYKFGTTAYVIGDETVLTFSLAGNNIAGIQWVGLIDQTSSQCEGGSQGGGVAPSATVANQPLLAKTDGSVDPTVGDGTLTIVVYYTVESVS